MELKNINWISLELSRYCNLNCSYCYQGSEREKKHMPEKIAMRAISVLYENCSKSAPGLVFFGGEPLLNFELLKKCIAKCKEYELKGFPKASFLMTTNGILLNKKIAKYLKDNNVVYAISLDGVKNDHDRHRKDKGGNGSFSKIVRNIKEINSLDNSDGKTSFHIRSTITHDNKNYKALFELLKELQTINFSIQQAYLGEDDENSLEAYENHIDFRMEELIKALIKGERPYDLEMLNNFTKLYIPQYKHPFVCSAGVSLCSVDVNGDIQLCHRFFGTKEYILGNIMDEKIIIQDIENVPMKTESNPHCTNCKALAYCEGMCYHVRLHLEKDVDWKNLVLCKQKNLLFEKLSRAFEIIKEKNPHVLDMMIRKFLIDKKLNDTLIKHSISMNKEKTSVDVLNEEKKIYKQNAKYFKIEGDDGVLFNDFDIESGFIINKTSSDIWNLLDGKKTVKNIIEEVQQIFETVEKEKIEADVSSFIATIRELDFIDEVWCEKKI